MLNERGRNTRIHPAEIGNMRRHFQANNDQEISWPQFMAQTVPTMPPEVECEPCGAPYIKGAGLCHNADEFEAPTGGHITFQLPRRPWNR